MMRLNLLNFIAMVMDIGISLYFCIVICKNTQLEFNTLNDARDARRKADAIDEVIVGFIGASLTIMGVGISYLSISNRAQIVHALQPINPFMLKKLSPRLVETYRTYFSRRLFLAVWTLVVYVMILGVSFSHTLIRHICNFILYNCIISLLCGLGLHLIDSQIK